jgi:hypothetical protein
MSAVTIGGIVFAVVFGGALLGMRIRAIVPEDHLSHESRDVIKLGMGLIGTMAALVLSLLISSAKASFDTRVGEVNQLTANVMRLDRTLAHYGAETPCSYARSRSRARSSWSSSWISRWTG